MAYGTKFFIFTVNLTKHIFLKHFGTKMKNLRIMLAKWETTEFGTELVSWVKLNRRFQNRCAKINSKRLLEMRVKSNFLSELDTLNFCIVFDSLAETKFVFFLTAFPMSVCRWLWSSSGESYFRLETDKNKIGVRQRVFSLFSRCKKK